MTATELVDLIRAYGVRREIATTTSGGIDTVVAALNFAKRRLMKEADWFMLKQQVAVTIPVTGLDITTAANGRFYKLTEIWKPDVNGDLGDKVELREQSELHGPKEDVYKNNVTTAYQLNKKLFIKGATDDVDVILIGYYNLPNYELTVVEEDIFTEYAEDYLQLFALRQLQAFKKDDDRGFITKSMLDEELRALLRWNGSLEQPNQSWEQ
ncbi:hypothetical protein N9064_00680 [bacterium]|nr:hypothetical protein [bacterium]